MEYNPFSETIIINKSGDDGDVDDHESEVIISNLLEGESERDVGRGVKKVMNPFNDDKKSLDEEGDDSEDSEDNESGEQEEDEEGAEGEDIQEEEVGGEKTLLEK